MGKELLSLKCRSLKNFKYKGGWENEEPEWKIWKKWKKTEQIVPEFQYVCEHTECVSVPI